MVSPQRIGRYQLIERLGSGSFGEVWRAHDPNLSRTVAVKVLWPHLAREENVVRRFLHEGRIAANIVHPNVVQVFDAGSEGDSHYLVMEYVPGSLEGLLGERGKLPFQEALDLTRQVLEGLAAAHQQGVTHRDIKPGNVLIASDDTPQVADFGIARAADLSGLSRSGYGPGTPRYMAPEQFEGRADSRSDIYSVGVMLYELISGVTPYPADTPHELMRQHFDAPIPRLPVGNQVAAAVHSIIEGAMAKRPEDRFQTAAAMIGAIDQALNPPEVPAAPPRAENVPASPPSRPRRERSTVADGAEPSRRRLPMRWVYTMAFGILAVAVLAAVGLYAQESSPAEVVGREGIPPADQTAIAENVPTSSPAKVVASPPTATDGESAAVDVPTPTEAADSSASGAGDVAAIVEGEEITESELDARFQQAQARAAQQGQSIQGQDQIDQAKGQILEQLVNETLLRQEAKEEGISASQSEVDSQLEQVKGQFPDQQTLEAALEQQGMTEEDFRDLIADNLVIQELVQTVIDEADISQPSEEEIQALYEQLSSQQQDVPPLDQIRDQIVQQLTQGERQQVVQDFIDQLKEDAEVQILR